MLARGFFVFADSGMLRMCVSYSSHRYAPYADVKPIGRSEYWVGLCSARVSPSPVFFGCLFVVLLASKLASPVWPITFFSFSNRCGALPFYSILGVYLCVNPCGLCCF